MTDQNSVSPPDQWNDVKAGFLDHIDEINKDLAALGLPALSSQSTAAPSTPEPATSQTVVSSSSLPVPRENLEKTCPTEAPTVATDSPGSSVSAPWEIVPDVKTNA